MEVAAGDVEVIRLNGLLLTAMLREALNGFDGLKKCDAHLNLHGLTSCLGISR